MSRDHHQPRSHFRRPTLGRCKLAKAAVIDVIDVDNMDSTNTSPAGVRGNSHQSGSGPIKIKFNGQACRKAHVIGVNGKGDDLDSNTFSKKKVHLRSNESYNVIDLDEDDCQILEGSYSNFRFSNRAANYHGAGPGKKYYGLYGDSGAVSSESETSDCEVIEDPSGKFREDWEKAALRKKMTEDQGSGSDRNSCSAGSSCHKNFCGCTCQGSLDSGTSAWSTSMQFDEQADFWRPFNDHFGSSSMDDVFQMEQVRRGRVDDTSSSSVESFSFLNASNNHPTDFKSSFYGGNECRETDGTHYDCGVQKDGKEKASTETLNDMKNVHIRSGDVVEGISFQHRVESVKPGITSVNADCILSENGRPAREGPITKQNSVFDGKENLGDQVDSFSEHFRKCTKQQTDLLSAEQTSSSCDDTVSLEKTLCLSNGCLKQSLAATREAALVQDDLINMREKHKESEEYRRAEEEEWIARQHQLQKQAEEAQRFRRRKKAEALRLVDMERRQKQRVNEIRETQKKVEETINLKESLRVKCRKELEILEVRCCDMASLLRALGISVAGGFYPLPNEVNVAYKKALLKFHPDRTSRSNIQLQVEAEEKFKLITRLKEKLLPVA